jgi:hypothetical protein
MTTPTITIDPEPTLEMCIAYMRALGWPKGEIDSFAKHSKIGGPHEPGLATGLRAAIAVAAGLPLDHIKRGSRPQLSEVGWLP